MARQFQHSTNVECGKIMRNSTAFKFELRHIPTARGFSLSRFSSQNLQFEAVIFPF